MTNATARRPSLARSAMKLLCAVLGLILAVLAALTLSIHSLMERMNYVGPEFGQVLPGQEGFADRFRNVFQAGSGGDWAPGSQDSQVLNILLIGQDRREGEERARSDAMILCSYNRATGTLMLTSILRDLYVQIPGYQDNRINAAYASGGMALLDKTLEENLGIRVDGNVEVDFDQFSRIIDLLGGVTLELRQDEAELINHDVGGSLTEGTCRLTGIQALTYARIRKLDADGDFSRTERQQKVLRSLLDACRESGFVSLAGIVDDLLPMITTDIPAPRLAAYALELLPRMTELNITGHKIPAEGTYSAQNIRGMSVLMADMEENQEAFLAALWDNPG